jgi:hypothetical protein
MMYWFFWYNFDYYHRLDGKCLSILPLLLSIDLKIGNTHSAGLALVPVLARARRSQSMNYHLVCAHFWPDIYFPCSLLAHAELSTSSRSNRILPQSICLSHQFSFHALGRTTTLLFVGSILSSVAARLSCVRKSKSAHTQQVRGNHSWMVSLHHNTSAEPLTNP